MRDKGVLELPMQYIVAIVVAGIAISLMIVGGYSLWKDYETKKAIKEVKRILNEAELIYTIGGNNANITLEVNFPSSVKKIVFASNSCYTLMKWGENRSFITENAKFHGKTVLYGSTTRVTLELVKNNGEKYVKIIPE